jgi:Lon protease-like protein
MFELPLFPLQTVLFPGAPLHLHIFEERYKRLIETCIQDHKPFGVVLIHQGQEALGPLAEPHEVGCSAEIVHVRRLKEGHMNIVVLGQERFRIFSLDRESYPYLMGTVGTFPLAVGTINDLVEAGERLRPWVKRFIRILLEAGGTQFDLKQLPEDPILLAYTAASILQIPPSQKQALLDTRLAEQFVASLLAIYRRESALLDAIIANSGLDIGSPFSRN